MAFLTFNNITIPVSEGTASISMAEPTSTKRSTFGSLTYSKKFKRIMITGDTPPVTQATGDAIEGLLSGGGFGWSFRDDLAAGVKGLTPKAQDGTVGPKTYFGAIDKTLAGYDQSAAGEFGVYRMRSVSGDKTCFHIGFQKGSWTSPTANVNPYTVGLGYFSASAATTFYRNGLIFAGNFHGASVVPADYQKGATAAGYLGGWTVTPSTTGYNHFLVKSEGQLFDIVSTNAWERCNWESWVLPYALTPLMLDQFLQRKYAIIPPPFVGVAGDLVSDFLYPSALYQKDPQSAVMICYPRMKSRKYLYTNSGDASSDADASVISFELVEQPLDMAAEGMI